MAYSLDALAAYQRRRWMQPNAHLYMRPDAHRFIRSDAARSMPNADRWRHPDEKLWNLHAAHQRRAKFAPEMGQRQPLAAELARLQAQHDALRGRFIAWKGELARTRALERAEAKRLKRRSDAARDKFIAAFKRHWNACRKALHPSHYDPNQPRVPAGHPDGGQWTSDGPETVPATGGANDPRVLSDATPDNDWIPGARYAQNDSSRLGASGSSPPLGEPPAIPPERPPTAQERSNFLKAAAKWMAAALRLGRSISPFVSAYEAMSWLDTDRPFMEAYLDPPKTLEELQEAVSEPRSGYHIHHIVEQGPALQAGYGSEQVDARENLVRIPALKHLGDYRLVREEK